MFRGNKPPNSIKWREAEKLVKALGAVPVRQESSHRIYKRKTRDGTFTIVIPLNNDIEGDLLASIIRQTGVSKKVFWKAYLNK